MFTIVPKNTISSIPINEATDEAYKIFKNRQELHKTIKGFHVYINQYAWDAFLNHGMNIYKQTKHEAQGIFLGRYFKDSFGEFSVATEYSEGIGESSHAYVGMSEECVADISRKCSSENLLMLIWVHTHPNFGVFYSGTDVNCLKTNFYMPFQVGIVVDIIRKESNGFKVEGKNVIEFAEYSIYNISTKRIFKPYEIIVHEKNTDLKKNESLKVSEFSTKQFLEDFNFIKKELSELKSLLNKKTELNKQKIIKDTVFENKTYFDIKFDEIKQLIIKNNDYTEDINNIIHEQSKVKKYFILFLIALFLLFVFGFISFAYLLINSIYI